MSIEFYYVYMLQSLADLSRFYAGITRKLKQRLSSHNAGWCVHTSHLRPWQIETAVAFRSREKAVAFEKYLKSHSGRAFASKHF